MQRTIVAVSRNPGSRLDELATSLSANGTTLVTVAADAADEAAMSALFDRFGADLPPLGGIYLAAFGGGPVTLRDMTDDDVIAMFRPKLDVVSVLHKLSLNHPLRQFVLFSSISGVPALAGWLTTRRPPPSSTLSPMRAEQRGCRPRRSTGDSGSRCPTPKPARSVR